MVVTTPHSEQTGLVMGWTAGPLVLLRCPEYERFLALENTLLVAPETSLLGSGSGLVSTADGCNASLARCMSSIMQQTVTATASSLLNVMTLGLQHYAVTISLVYIYKMHVCPTGTTQQLSPFKAGGTMDVFKRACLLGLLQCVEANELVPGAKTSVSVAVKGSNKGLKVAWPVRGYVSVAGVIEAHEAMLMQEV